MKSLYESLMAYAKEDYYPMHMPGHKRNTALMKAFNPYAIDITEINGFDNLHHADGVLKDLMQRIEALYHTKRSFLLMDGSTLGILSGISALTKEGDRILMARNSHKSVYNAVYLRNLDPVYLYPQPDGVYGLHGGILPEEVEEMLITYPDIKLVVITSPTYEGIVSDVGAIAEIAHKHGVPVLVDEAHGAHLSFHPYFPKGSMNAGADVVIHSIHKTLPAFTQTALLHVNTDRVDVSEIERYLGIYETSSPSYVMMAGIDQCIHLLEEKADSLFEAYAIELQEFYKNAAGLKRLSVLKKSDYVMQTAGIYDIDPSKIVISVKNTDITGSELSDRLRREYHIELEMCSFEYALAMTSIADTKEGFERLWNALSKLDEEVGTAGSRLVVSMPEEKPVKRMIPSAAVNAKTILVPLDQAAGALAADYVTIYPPGIPCIVPGEEIGPEIVECLMQAKQEGLEVLGLKKQESYISVIDC